MPDSTKISPLFIVIAIVAVSIGVFTQISGNQQAELPELAKTIILPKAKILNDAAFIDHRGAPFGLDQMRGKWSIVFFGFTNCPDICPTTMQTLSAVKKTVSEAGSWDNYQVIMVSVDPERDTTERLANYVPYFDPTFIGLSADLETTTAFAKQLGILFVKRDAKPLTDQKQRNEFYQVDHSASIILIDPNGQWSGVITAPHKADEISSDLIKIAQYSEQIAPPIASTLTATPSSRAVSTTKTNISQSSNEISKPVLADPALAAYPVGNNSQQQDNTKASLSINNTWIRPAPPNAPSMAGYMDLINNSDQNIRLVDVQSTAFARVMFHETKMTDGVASMHHIDELVIPANSGVVLRPLGMHMMLMQANNPLGLGDEAEVVMTDSNGRQYTSIIKVEQRP